MNRNTESHFALNPTSLDIGRSTFDRSSSVKFSFNTGDIVPFFIDEVLPGDTFKIATSKVVRLQTLLTPMMDNLYLDTYYFFVPNRLVWEHWKEFNGENTQSAWLPENEYSVPQIVSPATTGFAVGTIADYLGVPTGVPDLHVSALPFRAYALICNEWFRDENLSDPLVIPTDETEVTGVNTGTFVTDVAKGGLPYTAAKYHDYFTSCLPAPQKGPDVQIPVGQVQSGMFPVYSLSDAVDYADIPTGYTKGALNLNNLTQNNTFGSAGYLQAGGGDWNQTTSTSVIRSSSATGSTGQPTGIPMNLWADVDLTGEVQAATINSLRLAFQIQKLYEKDARGGTRYIEILKTHFGVTSPDARLQRPEYLGGNRLPVNVNQVIQSSGTESTGTPQGNTAAFSLTTDKHGDFTRSFTEHGFVIGVCVARYDHTYQQGLERFWSRKTRFDYYWPVFANIGEQAVKNKEIYAQADTVLGDDNTTPVNDEVFGYQEAWADYRYKPNRTAGEMRSQASQSLDVWHLGDDYASLPALSDAWIREDKTNVDRVLAVTSSVSNQIFADFYIQNRTTRPMPMYSVPGLIDHH